MLEKFHYHSTATGADITLPWQEDAMTYGFLEDHAGVSEDQLVRDMIRAVTVDRGDETTYQQIRALPIREFQEFTQAWSDGDQTVGVAGLGESSASTSGSETTPDAV